MIHAAERNAEYEILARLQGLNERIRLVDRTAVHRPPTTLGVMNVEACVLAWKRTR